MSDLIVMGPRTSDGRDWRRVGEVELDRPCPHCLSSGCAACGGTGYMLEPSGEALLSFLRRHLLKEDSDVCENGERLLVKGMSDDR